MKFRRISAFALALSFTLTCCTACAPGEVKQTNESLTISYYMPDYGSANDLLNNAVRQFRQTHPDVQLIIERETRDPSGEQFEAYFTKLAAEVMSGKGPDLFWVDSAYVDPYKMMDAGAFADLSAFMEKDPAFSEDTYNMAVINGIRYKGCQYIMPLNYSIPLLLSEKGLLEEAGFDYEHCTDFTALWNELAAYSERSNADPSLTKPLRSRFPLEYFPNWIGISWMDPETRQTDFSAEQWLPAFEQYRIISSTLPDETREQNRFLPSRAAPIWMMDGEFLFEAYTTYGEYSDLITGLRGLASMGDPCMVPVYDLNGGLQAQITDAVGIRRTSPNQQLAYDFIKALLAPEVQSLTSGMAPSDIPVSNEALKQTLKQNEEPLGDGWTFTGSDPIPEFAPIPPAVTQAFYELTQKATGSFFLNETRKLFRNGMRPYFEGKMSYEDAIRDAEETMEIYITE